MSICPKFFFLHLQLFLKRFQCQLRVICTWAHSQHGKLPGKPATVWLFGSLQPRVKREIPAAKGTLHCILAFLIQLISEELNLHVKITPGALVRLMSVGDHQELTATEKSSQPLSNPTWRFEKNVGGSAFSPRNQLDNVATAQRTFKSMASGHLHVNQVNLEDFALVQQQLISILCIMQETDWCGKTM